MTKKHLWKNDIMALIWVLPFLIITGVMPLVVRLRVVELSAVERVLYENNPLYYDFFNKVRSEIVIACAIGAVMLLIAKVVIKKQALTGKKFMIPMVIYLVMVIISTIIAGYRKVFIANYEGIVDNVEGITQAQNLGLIGYLDRYEGLFVLLGYVTLSLTAYYLIESSFQRRAVLNASLISATLMAIVGGFQYFGIDILQSKIGLWLMVPEKYAGMRETIEFAMVNNYSNGLLNHPNYFGGYLSMVLFLAFGLYFNSRSVKLKALYFMSSLIIFLGLLTSNSSTGLIAAGVGIISFILMILKNKWRPILTLAVSAILVVVIINALSGNRIRLEIESMSDEVKMLSGNYKEDNFLIDAVDQVDQGIKISADGQELSIIIDQQQLKLYDAQGKVVTYESADSRLTISDDRYNAFRINYIGDKAGLAININNKVIYCMFYPDRIEVIGPGRQGYSTDEKAPSFGFEGLENFATKRGFIWSRTLPLVGSTIIVGMGPDTFATVYPHYDVIANANYFGATTDSTDKPHNLYLQVAVNTGVIALLMLCLIIGHCIVQLIIKGQRIQAFNNRVIVVSIAMALISFLVSGIANDSVITITSIMWVYIGIGYKIVALDGNEVI